MDLAYEFPNLASQSVTLHGFKALIEALPDTIRAQMLDLQAQICLNPILRLDLLYRLKQDGYPLVLGVRFRDVQPVDRLHFSSLLLLFLEVFVFQLFVHAESESALSYLLIGFQSGRVRQRLR